LRAIRKLRQAVAETGAQRARKVPALKGEEASATILDWRHYSVEIYLYRRLGTANQYENRPCPYKKFLIVAATTTQRLSSLRPNLQNIPIRTEEAVKFAMAHRWVGHVFGCGGLFAG
jgi:DNA polymerase I-like protein with 3'-5' exonuclease and polymerase domains